MYLLIEKTHDNMDFVLLGPMEWRPRFFQSCLRDDLEIDFNVPLSNDKGEAIIINDIARIIPIIDLGITSECNPKMQRLIGPKYNFFETYAEMYYDVADKPIDDIKLELKQIVAANRYKYEVAGITVNIQNQDIKIFTNREDRGLYLQAFQLGKDNINWKFGDVFLTLLNNDLSSIVQSIADHVQACFDWEATKNAEIDSATFEQLDSINLKSDNTIWEPIMEQPLGLRLV